jgi:hypothetical protein
MRKTLIAAILTVLLLAIIAVPKATASAKRVTVSATQSGSIGPGLFGIWWITNGDRLQLRDWAGSGVLTLNIPGGDTYTGSSTSSSDLGMVNLATGESVVLLKTVWDFGSAGMFIGIMHFKATGATFANPTGNYLVNANAELKGNGSFEGQKLILSYQGPKPPINWEGFLIR